MLVDMESDKDYSNVTYSKSIVTRKKNALLVDVMITYVY